LEIDREVFYKNGLDLINNNFMKNIFKIALASVLLSFSVLIFPVFSTNASTAGIIKTKGSSTDVFVSSAGFSTAVEAENIVATIIKTVLSLLGVIFVALMIFSGYQWMTAGGNEDAIKKAKGRIINAIIGLAIVVFAYGVTAFVFKNLPTGGSSTVTPGPK